MASIRETATRLRGVIAALPTPMDEGFAVDLAGTGRLTKWLVSKRVDAIFACGTTGEGPLLTDAERVAVVRTVVRAAGGRVRVIAHVGAATTAQTVDLARRCADAGADALGVITPYFFRYSDEELSAHFAAVAAAAPDRAVLAYSLPVLAGSAVTPTLVRALRAIPNLVGLKDSSGDAYGLVELAEAGGAGFRLVVGADLLSLEVLAMGWAGMISGPASAIPEPYVALWATAAGGSWPEVAGAYRQVAAVCHLLRNGDIPHIKAALALRGVIGPHVRPPLRPLDERQMADLRAAVISAPDGTMWAGHPPR